MPIRVLLFVVLSVGFPLYCQQQGVPPLSAARLVAFFVCGAWSATVAEGPTIGSFPPVSTRPLMIFLGVAIMVTDVV